MAVDLTVPPTNEMKPLPPVVTPPEGGGTETNAAGISKGQATALAKLRQKNRKGNEFIITLPLVTTMESGTVYSLSGFTPDAEPPTKWVLIDVVLSFKGKSGSTTKCTFQKALTY
jgi:hypothetical protein